MDEKLTNEIEFWETIRTRKRKKNTKEIPKIKNFKNEIKRCYQQIRPCRRKNVRY
jgi:peptidoglycan hydrolase CwlO-like protein